MAQRTVLYLGEVNDQQAVAWRKSLEVFDEGGQSSLTLSLFPEDREIPPDAADGLRVKMSGLELRRARAFGHLVKHRKESWGLIGQHHQSDRPFGAANDVEYVGISLTQTRRLGKHDEGVGKGIGSCPS